MRKLLLYVILLAFVCDAQAVLAQGRVITGIVQDQYGPLAGATVTESGTRNSVPTNNKGEFRIVLRENTGKLIFSYVNYVKQVITIKRNSDVIDVKLEQNTSSMEEVTVTGFGQAKPRTTMTGAVSSINAKEIEDVPTSSVQNALAGRLPGFVAVQRSGQPGHDASDFYIRGVNSLNSSGSTPLILVDDIEYDYDQLAQINVNEIESITILKDASSTAIYGIKGANGVLLVTTKRGIAGRPKFQLRGETGFQQPVLTPHFLDSYDGAVLVNQANVNDGLSPKFTDADLQHFKTHDDPYGHPDINWYKAINRHTVEQVNADLDVSGGTHNVKYFITGGVFSQNGSVRNFGTEQAGVNSQGVNNNYFYNRYNVRSNLDIQATKNLSLRMDVTTRYMDVNQPSNQNVTADIFNYADYHPWAAPFLNPNGSFAYAYAYDLPNQLPTLNALLAAGGYTRDRRTDFNALMGFDEKLGDITEGLALTGRLAYSSQQESVLTLNHAFNNPPSYHYDPTNGSYTLNTGPNGGGYVDGVWASSGYPDLDIQNVDAQIYFSYDRTFARAHHFNSLLLWHEQTTRNDDNPLVGQVAAVPSKFRGYSLKIGYDYKQKYLLDLNAALNGSDRFHAQKRNGFFPAVGVGWNVAKEKFFGDLLPKVNLFKFRATYGIVGSDIAPGNQYLYQQTYNNGSSYSFGQQPQGQATVYEGPLGNNNVTWSKSRKTDFGLDMNLFGDKLSSTTDYFHEYVFDQLVTPGNVPLILGIGLSPTNVGITTNQGWEETLTWAATAGKVFYSIGVVYTHNRNKVIYEAEAAPRYPWLAVTGHQINQPFGYIFEGYYTQADINSGKVAKPNTAAPPVAGDIKYKDLNGDGVIDQNDETAIGRPNIPNTTVGLPIKLGYKGFDLSILFQGAFQYSLSAIGTGIEPFQSQWQPIHQQAWTPTNTDPKFPRLTTDPTTINSPTNYMSDFWLVNARYIRLKTVDFSYQIPKRSLPFRFNSARVYLSAYNLLTWTNVWKKYQTDPEAQSNTVGDAYMNNRVLNIGLQVGL